MADTKIATWNVNSVRSRLDRLIEWLKAHRPDVLCLQELKCETAVFPYADLEAIGYRAAVHGQKTYNGVAILATSEISDVATEMEGGEDDREARFIGGTVGGVRVICVYVPNGQTVGSDKYAYKRVWLERLRRHLESSIDESAPLVVCGDMNIAPEERDIARVEQWRGSVLFNDEMTAAFNALLDAGLVDVFRKHRPEADVYSWWDYRALAFPKGNGLRIDHILATRAAADRSTEAFVDREERKGKKPSDHAPVVATFALDG